MKTVTGNLIIDQVKSLIIKAIDRFAKEKDGNRSNIFINISSIDKTGYPVLYLVFNNKRISRIDFIDLCTKAERLKYLIFSFDIERDLPKWLQKFNVKSAEDNDKDILKTDYLLINTINGLKAFMCYEGKMVKEIEIDYILETK